MMDPTRRELLQLIEELSAACPEYRFGQLVLNLAFLAREDGDQHVWQIEDSEFLDAARKHLADWSARHGESEAAPPTRLSVATHWQSPWHTRSNSIVCVVLTLPVPPRRVFERAPVRVRHSWARSKSALPRPHVEDVACNWHPHLRCRPPPPE